MTSQQDVTGTPNWQLARGIIAQLREMPAATAEAETEVRLYNVLQFLFPSLRYPDITTQYQSGDGPIDVYCRNVVFETKRRGQKDDARIKPDGSTETPEEQAVRYLDALTAQSSLFDDASIGWRAGITDGKEWSFYDYNRHAPDAEKLTPINTLRLDTPADDDALLAYLYDFVNRTAKLAPPTDNAEWANQQAQPFIDLAARYEHATEYDVKRNLWRGLLRGAFLNPQGDATAERDLFARHTMLVVTARAVAETLQPPERRTPDRERLHEILADGFAAWLIDAAGDDGANVLDGLIAEVNKYEWQAPNRDVLKNLYHLVIPRNIRHDFGEYYTPDWLARAVCEEVMNARWRKETIAMAVANQLNGPAVLDPSCGSGTFLFHATQLLLEEAAQHPELADSPPAQVEIVSGLVAGMDLHPVAVELSKTTKMLAFGHLATHYAVFADTETVHLCDSLQWELRRNAGILEFGETVEIPTDERDQPIRLPSNLLLSERFPELLSHIFGYANRPETPGAEEALVSVLNLPNPADRNAALDVYRRLRQYIAEGRNNVWRWYISNLIQPLRLANMPVSRMVGNPPWVVYNAMTADRQDTFRERARERNLWAGANLATQNDLAATFVATCVDYYLKTGGRFGFVLPYAALSARHWEPFRKGNWSLRQDAERGAHVDLSKDAWDFFAVNAPPFPQANSSVVFGSKVRANRQNSNIKPLANIKEATGSGVNTGMGWNEVKALLQWRNRREWPTAPSPAYAEAFRNGATLFPQSLVVFEQPQSRARGVVYFQTNQSKGKWSRAESARTGSVEEQFVKPALFSRLLLPLGITGNLYVVAPFTDGGDALVVNALPQGAEAARFRLFWDRMDQQWREHSSGRPPLTLLDQINYQGKLSSQLGNRDLINRVVYRKSGSWLEAAVVDAGLVIDGTLYWYASDNSDELHYLAAIFNAGCLVAFFNEAGRVSDRDFHTGPVQNLPIPAYDPNNEHHANLAAQSRLAHERVAALVAERPASGRRINRNDVLRDTTMQRIMASIDQSVRAILPAFCQPDAGGAVLPAEGLPTAQSYLAVADREFEAGNAQEGANMLWEAAKHALGEAARERGWRIDEDDPDGMLTVSERLAELLDESDGEVLLSRFSSAQYYPDKVRYGFFDLDDGDDVDARRIVGNFVAQVEQLAG